MTGTLIPRAQRVRIWRFSLVGASGLVVNTLALAVVAGPLGLHYLGGAIVATQVSTAWNFALTDRWVFERGRSRSGLPVRFLQYWVMNNLVLLARGPLLVLMTTVLGVHYLVSNVITLVIAFAVRFLVADRFIWRHPVPVVDGAAVP